jgi:WD40 repeat protein
VRFWDAADGHELGPALQLGERATAVAFDPTGARVVTAGESGRLGVWDIARASRLLDWSGSPSWISDVAYSPDGRVILTAGRQDHTGKLWSAADGRLVHTLDGHADNLMTASFSPDSRLVATVSVDGVAILWDAASGELLRRLVGPAYSVAFTADGHHLFTSGDAGYAFTWDLTLDERAPDAIAAEVAARSPWRLVDGRLVARVDGAGPSAVP